MEETKSYESFPAWMAILCNLVSIAVYALGAYILARFGVWVSALYLLYCLWMEVRVLKGSCVDCAYYGRLCGLGKGKVCAWLFGRGDPQRFIEKQVSWSNMLSDFMVLIFPLVGGIVLLVKDFAWLRAIALALFVVLYLGGSAVVRGAFACKYCRQRAIGCPAAKLFGQES
jgi:hypothetical protein